MDNDRLADQASKRVVLYPPTLKDGRICSRILREAGIESMCCGSMTEFCHEIDRGAGVALTAEEHLSDEASECLVGVLSRQPTWSDIPIVVLMRRGEFGPESIDEFNKFGNVTLSARPIRVASFICSIRAKLRDRTRQYAVRDLLRERDQAVAKLVRDIARRERAEAALTDSEGRSGALIQALSQMVWSSNAHGEVVEDSPSWRAFTGQSLKEFLGTGWLNAIHPEERQSTWQAWQDAMRTLQPYETEYRIRHRSRQWRWTSARGVPQLDQRGNVLRWVGMNIDITEQKRLQQSISESKQRLELALHAGGMAAWEWTPNYSIWEEALYKLLDLPDTVEAGHEALLQCVHAEDKSVLTEAWEFATSGQGPFRCEFRILQGNGQTRWLAGVGELVKNEAGEVTRIYGLNWEITQQRMAADALRKSEAEARRFKQLVEHYNDFVGIATPDQRWLYINAGGRRMVGLEPDLDITRTEILDVVSEGDRAVIQQQAIPALRTRGRWRGALNFRHCKSGRDIPTLWSAFAIQAPDDDSQEVWVTISPNLTQQKKMELALRESEQQAREASRAKSEFVANMSHEIRTPMTAILGYADLLASKEEDPEKLGFVETITRNGQFLLEIINDILDLSKIEAGKLETVFEWFTLHDVVFEVFTMMQLRAIEKGITFRLQYDGPVPERIESDPKRLRQILVNLIGNAIKFTDEGSVHLNVFFDGEGTPPLLRFHVSDTGIGITRQQRLHLFEPFSQGDSSVTRTFGGTGLGLAISQRLAYMLGGEITVQSEAGKGSTFSCSVTTGNVASTPLVNPHDANASECEPYDEKSESDGVPLNCRVLVVDDRRDIRFLTNHFLQRAGAAVEFAEDGVQALERIERTGNGEPLIDVVLMDMQMPRLDGYQTSSRLREIGYRQPIIALTADAMHGDMTRCLENGCDAYLSKPIDAAQLVDLVARLTNQSDLDGLEAARSKR